MTIPYFNRPARLFWLLQTGGWLAYFALNFLAAIGYGKPWQYVYVSLSSAVFGFVITSILRYGYRRVAALPTGRMLGIAGALMLVATALYAKVFAEVVFGYCWDCRPSSVFGYIGYFGSALYVMLSWSGLYFGIKWSRELVRERETALKATAMAHEAQLKMLRYQLNPHFLFNTLNAISTLILDRQGDTANRMVTGLSGFLRHTLDSDPMQRVSLGEELAALERYLSIEQLRFGDRLRLAIHVSDEARRAEVPSLILQPLIENCIKYAVSKRIDGGGIEIAAEVKQGVLEMAVRDDGPGSADACRSGNGHGVGLANTRERLRVLFGERQSVSVRNLEPQGLEVMLRIPYQPARPESGA
jgi:LytS/YehU family sensor histidine kinase